MATASATPLPATPTTPMTISTPADVLVDDSPSYISARSANSIISEFRPTRIQAETLLVLNRLLDELLLLILSSARSLATDRIKSDGLLKVLNNNLLAKDAVLEAELELRSYMEGKRAEGAKVPLGLMATSRWDGTEAFPIASAYKALRIRCQHYSTLGDREDESAATDQNIMSPEGKPIATITPGVAIYVTALLEFIGEHILQRVGSVVERDNSDEASLHDLVAALTEDESTSNLYSRLLVREEVQRRLQAGQARRSSRRPLAGDENGRSNRSSVKPWQVPAETDFDEAAGQRKFDSRRISVLGGSGSVAHERVGSATGSGGGNAGTDSARDSLMSSMTTPTMTSQTTGATTAYGSSTDAPTAPPMARRASSEKSGWGAFKRRGSLRGSQDVSANQSAVLAALAKGNLSPADARGSAMDDELELEDDFEAALMGAGTMKVSLTPNRLRTIEVADEEKQSKRSRKRPGTVETMRPREEDMTARSAVPSPAPSRQSSTIGDEAPTAAVSALQSGRSASARNLSKLQSPPPSSYRSPSPAITSVGPDQQGLRSPALVGEEDIDEDGKPGLSNKDMYDVISSTLPATNASNASLNGRRETTRMRSRTSSITSQEAVKKPTSSVSGRMRNLFGRKSVQSAKDMIPNRNGANSSMSVRTDMSREPWANNASEENLGTYAESVPHGDMRHHMGGSLGRNFASSPVDTTSSSGRPALPRITSESPPPPPKPITKDSSLRYNSTASPDDELAGDGQSQRSQAPASVSSGIHSHAHYQTASAAAAAGVAGQTTGVADDSLAPDLGQRGRPATPPSPPPQAKEAPISRKVPWTYSRRSSTGPRPASGAGTPSSELPRDRGSLGYSASDDVHQQHHHQQQHLAQHRGTGAEQDSWPSKDADGGRTPTPGYSLAAGAAGVGAAAASAAMMGMHSGLPSGRAGGEGHALRILVDLERKMRDATSVDECRTLVSRAMGMVRSMSPQSAAGDSQISSTGEIADIPDEDSDVMGSGGRRSAAGLGLGGLGTPRGYGQGGDLGGGAPPAVPNSRFAKPKAQPILAMADDYDADIDTSSPAWRHQGDVVAWLLDSDDTHVGEDAGGGSTISTLDAEPSHQLSNGAVRPSQQSYAANQGSVSVSSLSLRRPESPEASIDNHSTFASADEGEPRDAALGNGNGTSGAPASAARLAGSQRSTNRAAAAYKKRAGGGGGGGGVVGQSQEREFAPTSATTAGRRASAVSSTASAGAYGDAPEYDEDA